MAVTKIKLEDVEAISSLVNSCYRGDDSLQGWTSEAAFIDGQRTTPEMLKKDMLDPSMTILKYVDNTSNEIIGCVYCHKKDDAIHSGMLCVKPQLQKKGIGKNIMEAVENYAKDLNCSVVKIDVINIRHSLIEWYKRRWFKETGKLTPFPPPEVGVGILECLCSLLKWKNMFCK